MLARLLFELEKIIKNWNFLQLYLEFLGHEIAFWTWKISIILLMTSSFWNFGISEIIWDDFQILLRNKRIEISFFGNSE